MQWICPSPKCGFAGSNDTGVPMEAHEFPIHCICGFTETYEEASARLANKPHWLTCSYRGEVIGEINAAKAGCGCSSEHAQIYHCNHFGESVMKRSADRCQDTVTAVAPGYPSARQRETCDLIRFTRSSGTHVSSASKASWERPVFCLSLM